MTAGAHVRLQILVTMSAVLAVPGLVLAQQGGAAAQRAPTTIESITVTAEKREADLQDTGLSIQAFGQGDMERSGMDRSEDIGGFTPGFQMIPATGSNSQVAFAGRGSVRTDNHPINEQSVGLYIDGIYHGTGEASLFELLDIERIEVLKGPQGTLFGRNTVGGAISVVSRKPSPEFGGSLKLGFGQDDYFGLNAAVDVPLLSERLLSRIAVLRKKRDAFTGNNASGVIGHPVLLVPGRDDFDDQDAWGGRAALRFLASENLTIDYSYDRLNHDQRTPAFAVSTPGNSAFEDDNGDISADGGNWDKETVQQHSLNIEWEVSPSLTLKSISGLREYHGSRLSDLDGSINTFGGQGIAHFRNNVDTRAFYQELQAVGTVLSERLDYALGLNYFADESEILNRGEVFNDANNNMSEVKGDNYSWGLFGQLNYHFTERLDLTFGLRYSSERREAEHSLCRGPTSGALFLGKNIDACPAAGIHTSQFTANGTPGTGPANAGVLGLKDSVRFNNWSPLVRASYHWTDEIMTYLSWSRGYRAGGFQNRPANGTLAAFAPYKEETVSQWEMGIKSRFFDNRLQLNGSAFYSEYEDQQVARLLPGDISTRTDNAGKSRIRGWELEARAVPFEGLELRVAHGFTNTDFSEFTNFNTTTMMNENIANQRCICQQPKRTWSGWATYTLPAMDLGTLQLTANFRRNGWALFNSVRASAGASNANLEQTSFTVYGAQATLLDAFGKEGLSLALIGRNITDTVYAVNGIQFSAFQGLTYGDPRHWIAEIGYEF